MLSWKPDARPSALEALRHPYFTGAELSTQEVNPGYKPAQQIKQALPQRGNAGGL